MKPLFVDTSGWYALLDRRDPVHRRARDLVSKTIRARRALLTTDYVIDETCTLARMRSGGTAAIRFLRLLDETAALRTEWIGSGRFDAAKGFFEKHLDQSYSFTDCTSFMVMRELRLTEALTADAHFAVAGYKALLTDT